MYANDNADRLAINNDASLPNSISWISGILTWATPPDDTNTDYFVNDTYSLLGANLGRNYKVFACPAANYVSSAGAAARWSAWCRSVAMDAVGDGPKFKFSWGQVWWAKKLSQLQSPGPSGIWVFKDEHPDSIDDGDLSTSYTSGTGQFIGSAS